MKNLGDYMKTIAGFPEYQVTVDGGIWSKRWGKFLCQSLFPNGYLYVQLRNKTTHKQTTHSVHRLVLKTFKGPCPHNMECCHNNGSRTDNRVENLRWDTHRANMAEGQTPKGSKNGRAKLIESQVFVIRELRNKGFTLFQIAKKFGVSHSLIWQICQGSRWGHLQ